MDYWNIAQSAAETLAPALPFLLIGGKKALEEAGRKIGSDAYDKAKSLWSKVNFNKKIQDAAKDVAISPDNATNRQGLAQRLEELFIERPDIAEQVNNILKIKIGQEIKDVSGEAIALDVKEVTKGEIDIAQGIQTVSAQGEATALNAEKISGGSVKTYQTIDKVEKGARATAAKINRI